MAIYNQMSPAAWSALNAEQNPRMEITAENMRLGAPATGRAYAEAVKSIEEAKAALADGSSNLDHTEGWEAKRPAPFGTEDARLDRVITEAEKRLGR